MRIAVIGAGAIGLTHCETIAAVEGCAVAGVADPFDAGASLAARFGTTHFRDPRELLARERPDGAIVAAPNELHLPIALDCIAAGVPVLVEKPVTNSLDEARQLLEAASEVGVPVLVGHHRRHHPFIQRAHEIVASGALGRIACVSASYFLLKPADYFGAAWRRTKGTGTFLINLIHEIDPVVPLRRIATPEDMADVIAFLASSRAAYVSGQEIVVDGGFAQTLMSRVPRSGPARVADE